MELPSIPVPLNDFIPYLNKHSRHEILTGEAMAPFKAYESKLREIFAQEPNHKAIVNPQVNVLPLYVQSTADVKVKARDLAKESPADAEKYILPLAAEARKKDSTPAIVPTFDQFLENFRIFSESSLVDIDWSNVVVSGSAVTTCLLPVPDKFRLSRKAQREYYHEKIAPSSDVDLFLYGLDEEQAIEKMKQIEKCIRNSILEEVSVIRTKNALTIVSKYPTRHVQIVLRLYKNVSEILTGFDVDCSCTAFDGRQVWATPRAIAAFATQANCIDLTRRSPSYENRLAKYAHRGFEVYWSALDRSRLDPTIFERSFNHVVGLARLMVMEKLPTQSSRENYIEQRREERGRAQNRNRVYYPNKSNMKEVQPEDVAEWVEQEDVSNYHTFTIPYGPKYTAKKIEKLVYKKDLLLNAEWNKPKDRNVNLHRHPAFFGSVEHVIEDCCGYCPVPVSDEEKATAEEEGKKYLSGKIQFLKNDPGRQSIGSFNPITDSDWTEFAYIGDTESLCRAIAEGDLAHVQKCCAQEDFNVDKRDYTGRMPLHLAIMCGTPKIVQCLVNHGARLVSRVAGGFTALHLAAARGDVEILRAILRKSEANQVEYLENSGKKSCNENHSVISSEDDDHEEEEDDISVVRSGTESPYAVSQGSMIMITDPSNAPLEEQNEDENEPNFYDDIGVLSWDLPLSPLHVAILYGHVDIITSLTTEFGANASQPFVRKEHYNFEVIFSMILAMHHPLEQCANMLRTLLETGASSTQATKNHLTAFHSLVLAGHPQHIDMMFDIDGPAAQLAIDYPFMSTDWRPHCAPPLNTAIRYKGAEMIEMLLKKGATVSVPDERLQRIWARRNGDKKMEHYLRHPIIQAAEFSAPAVVRQLLDAGADANAMTLQSHQLIDKVAYHSTQGQTVLDIICERRKFLKSLCEPLKSPLDITEFEPDAFYFSGLAEGTFEHSFVQNELAIAKMGSGINQDSLNGTQLTEFNNQRALKVDWIQREIKELEELEQTLKDKGGKSFAELHPSHASAVPKVQESTTATAVLKEKFEVPYTVTDLDLGDLKAKKYIPLFQAAWDGDIQKVKQLTTAQTTTKKLRSSLRLTAKLQARGMDIFAIAVARGHFELAKFVLQHVDAHQCKPGTKKSARKVYEVVVDNDSDNDSYDDSYNSDSEPDDSDNEGVRVRFDVVDDEQTIDDVREADVVNTGKYSTSALSLLNIGRDMSMFLGDENMATIKRGYELTVDDHISNWCRYPSGNSIYTRPSIASRRIDLINFAVQRNDMATVKFLVEQQTHYLTNSTAEVNGIISGEPGHKFITVDSGLLNMCVKHGRTEMLGYLMSKTGLGFPFEALMKEAGIKADTEPKYYRGLSVYGKKRADWAAESGHSYRATFSSSHSLLLHAISEGNLDSVKWFLTDEPEKKYREFLHAHKDDPRLAPLFKMEGGIDDMLTSWLGARRNLALHCAILAPPSEEFGTSLIQFILKTFPGSLNTKNDTGYTPLHLAFGGRRIMAARMLVEAGADQTARDNDGHNMLHHIFTSINARVRDSPKLMKTLSEILDPEVVPILARQRSRSEIGSGVRVRFARQTPLSQWLSQSKGTEVAALKTILDITGGKELYVLNEQGNYPIHDVTKGEKIDFVRVLLERDPCMAGLENATGTTPLEVAENKLISHLIKRYFGIERNISASGGIQYGSNGSVSNLYRYFTNRWRKDGEKFDSSQIYDSKGDKQLVSIEDCTEGKIVQLLRNAATKSGKKRVLVSLQDANELVRRLSANQQAAAAAAAAAARVTNRDGDFDDHQEPDEDQDERRKSDTYKQDEVKLWINQLWRESFEVTKILEEEKAELDVTKEKE